MFLLVLSLFGFHGVIEQDTTWSDTAYLTGDVLVENGVTLTISPGTVVLYADSSEWDTLENYIWPTEVVDIFVEGNLKAMGTEKDSIIFCTSDEWGHGKGDLVMSNGWDSLSYCSLDKYSGILLKNVTLLILSSRIEGGPGIRGEKSRVHLENNDFQRYSFELGGGDLLVENCSFLHIEGVGGVIGGEDLDSYIVRHTLIRGACGVHASMSGVDGDDGYGCRAINCNNVEITNCVFDSISGGGGGPTGVSPLPGSGGDGFALHIEDCSNVAIDHNKISRILGGPGGENYETGERAPDGAPRPLVLYNSSPRITNNEFNSKGRYIYIDSTSQPIIGGAPDKGNRFLNAAARDYVIYNDSPNDINAMYNFWQTGPDMIDSLIFDYYDDPTKGIVHYDHSTDVEEKKSPTQPFALRSNLVKDILHVSLSRESTGGLVQLALFDASGRRVHSQSISGSQAAIDVSGLPRGIYFISARIGKSKPVTPVTPVTRVTRKVIIR